MNRHRLFIAGLLLLAVSSSTLGYLQFLVVQARVKGVFRFVVTETPIGAFQALQCPGLLNRNEAGSVRAVIRNPTDHPLNYVVSIDVEGLTASAPQTFPAVPVEGGQTAEVAWSITPLKSGPQALVVQALSDEDRRLPGTPVFHMWPTSFRESCGIQVINFPLPMSGGQIMLLSGIGIAVGGLMAVPQLISKARRLWARKAGAGR